MCNHLQTTITEEGFECLSCGKVLGHSFPERIKPRRRVGAPSRKELVDDHTNGWHRAPNGKPNLFCEVCDVLCPDCLEPARNRTTCHLSGLMKRSTPVEREAYKDRMGL